MFFAFLVSVAGLVTVLSLPPQEDDRSVLALFGGEALQEEDGEQEKDGFFSSFDAEEQDKREYRERWDPLPRQVRSVDRAIVQSLTAAEVKQERLRYVQVDPRVYQGQNFAYQELELQVGHRTWQKFVRHLRKTLHSWVPAGSLKAEEDDPRTWRIQLNELVTHRIVLSDPVSPPTPAPEEEVAGIALVIDDMGKSLAKAKELLDITRGSITLSILPRTPFAEATAAEAVKRGADVLLHQPMEPEGYPGTDPGAGALYVDMDKSQIRSTLEENLTELPAVVGMNNHMGSAFTKEEAVMEQTLQILEEEGLFYMDSLTTPESVASRLASRMDLDMIKRDVFLDNDKSKDSTLLQLQKAEYLAKRYGQAVVIGHPYPQTIRALREWIAEKDWEIQLRRLSSLVQERN